MPKPHVTLRNLPIEELDKRQIKADVLIINDLHLGAEFGKPREALKVLESVNFNKLVLGGDTFESDDFTHLGELGEEVAKKIFDIGKKKKVAFVAGNHDEDLPLPVLKEKLGLEEIVEFWQEKDVLVVHGHQDKGSFEEGSFMDWVGDTSDWFFRLLKLKNLHDSLGNLVYQLPKKVKENAIKYAMQNKSLVVISGHTHRSEFVKFGNITYLNSGSFAGPHLGFITVTGREVTMYRLQ
jgi:predicted phosphodiesterase